MAELNGKINDAALVTYTWGPDLSGTFGGAGGVGGLLGISKKTVPTANLACLYDGNGNITQLFDMATGDAKAHYEYDPFGNLINSEGVSGLESWNKFRFSTKQIEEEHLIPTTSSSAGVSPDLYYYGYRFYCPRLGRWINRDPIEERGGPNLYALLSNDPLNSLDPLGESPEHIIRGGAYVLCSACILKFGTFGELNYIACIQNNNALANSKYGGSVFRCIVGELKKDWEGMPWWEKGATLAGCGCCAVPLTDLFKHIAENLHPQMEECALVNQAPFPGMPNMWNCTYMCFSDFYSFSYTQPIIEGNCNKFCARKEQF
ncbi:MAG: RHS repeat domain-containing protein [Verrucomicrobiota bacterium]